MTLSTIAPAAATAPLSAAEYAALLDANVDRLLGAATPEEEAEARAYASRMWDRIALLGMQPDVMAALHARYRMPYTRGPR